MIDRNKKNMIPSPIEILLVQEYRYPNGGHECSNLVFQHVGVPSGRHGDYSAWSRLGHFRGKDFGRICHARREQLLYFIFNRLNSNLGGKLLCHIIEHREHEHAQVLDRVRVAILGGDWPSPKWPSLQNFPWAMTLRMCVALSSQELPWLCPWVPQRHQDSEHHRSILVALSMA
jgi:hypothetical protein